MGYYSEEDQIFCAGIGNAMGSAFGAIMTLPRRQCFCFSLAKRFTHTAADIIDFTAGFVLVQADASPGWNVEAHDFAVRGLANILAKMAPWLRWGIPIFCIASPKVNLPFLAAVSWFAGFGQRHQGAGGLTGGPLPISLSCSHCKMIFDNA